MKHGLDSEPNELSKKETSKVLCVPCSPDMDYREHGYHTCQGYRGFTKCECEECIELMRKTQERLKKEREVYSEFLKTFEEWKRSHG